MTVVRMLPGLLFGLFAFNASAAQPAAPQQVSASTYSLDLMTLYKESRLEDPRILSAYAHARSARQQEREAFGGLLPQVSASSNINRILRKDDQSRDIYDNKSYSLNLSQFIYNKEAWERYQKAKSVTLQKSSQSEDSQAEATVDLAKRYFAALAADDALELVSAERRATQGSLDRVNALYARQMAKITDMLDLKARVDLLIAQEIEARNQVRLSREGLSEIVGRPINDRFSRIRNDIALQAPTLPLDAWIAQALDSNPRLKAYESNLAAADAAVREGKGGHYPSLSFNLGASQSDVGYDNTLTPRSDSYVATIGLKVPIYSGGSTSARVSGLYDEQYAAEQDLEGVRRQVVKETTNAYLTAQSAVDKIRAGQNALASAKQSSIAAQKAFTYGVVNAVDVLTAVQNEFKARGDLLKSQYDFITNLFILNRWAGKLSQESVASVNVWLGGDDSEALKDLNNSAPQAAPQAAPK